MRFRWPLFVSLGLLAFLYLPKLGAPLIWDDRNWILFNPALDAALSWKDYLTPRYFSFSLESSWRPLATLSYQSVIAFAGRAPFALRSLGLAVHLLNGLLLGLALQGAGVASAARLLAVSLFLIHPAHAETLMCVAFNEELLCASGLLAMLVFHQRRRRGLAALAYVLAMLSKEPGVLGLPLVALFDWAARKPRPWRDFAAYLAVLGPFLWARFFLMRGPGGELNVSHLLPLGERLLYGARGLSTAVRIFFLPVLPRIEYFAVPDAAASAVFSIFALCAGLYLFLLRRLFKTDRVSFLWLLWPLLFLSLTSNIVPTGVLATRYLAERWLYLPYLGACAVLAQVLWNRTWLAAIVIAAWGALGARRTADWTRESRLWESLAAVYPWSAKAHEGLGEALFREGRVPDALAHFETALRARRSREDLVLARYVPLAPPGTLAWERASLYRWLGHSHLELHDDAEAGALLEKANGLDPADGFTYRALAYLEARRGRFDEAGRWLTLGLERSPADGFLLRLKPDIAARRLGFNARFQ